VNRIDFLHHGGKNFTNAHLDTIIPHEVVIQVLRSHTSKAIDELLQIVVVGVDVVDVIDALLVFTAFKFEPDGIPWRW